MVAVAEHIELEDIPAEVQIELLADKDLQNRSLQFILWKTGSLLRGMLTRDPTIAEVRDTLEPIHERLSIECIAGLSGDIQAALQKALYGAEAVSDSMDVPTKTVSVVAANADRVSQLLTNGFCLRMKDLVRHAMLIRNIVLEYQRLFSELPDSKDVYKAISALKERGYALEAWKNFDEDTKGRDKKIDNMIKYGSTNPLAAKAQNLRSVRDVSDIDSEDVEDEDGTFEDIDFEALGINPAAPTTAKPGTEEKVLTLGARYWAGEPLWHPDDVMDHRMLIDLKRLTRQQVGGQMLDLESGRKKWQ
jgi:hypothetical protein